MNRKKPLILGIVASLIAGTTLAVTASGVLAQGAPPDLPSTFYGPVSGGPQVGDPIVALVVRGNQQFACGSGTILNQGGAVYAVDVFADDGAQFDNCGAPGLTVKFYFPETKQFATQSGTWQAGLAPQTQGNPPVGFALQAGSVLSSQLSTPGVTKD